MSNTTWLQIQPEVIIIYQSQGFGFALNLLRRQANLLSLI